MGNGKIQNADILSARTEDSRRGEAKNLALFYCLHLDRREILRFAQNDMMMHYFGNLWRRPTNCSQTGESLTNNIMPSR